MKQISDTLFNEMLSVTKALHDRVPQGSVKYANTVRKAHLLYKKLLKIKLKTE